MQILDDSSESINTALNVLKNGGVVAHATETCYGLACDMTNSKAVEKLFKIKHRKYNQPVSALFSSIKDSAGWVDWCDPALKLAKKELPGPITIILPIKEFKNNIIFPIPDIRIHEYSNTIGIRISPHPIAMELSKKFNKPISTTSANISGNSNPYSVEEIQDQFNQSVKTHELLLPDIIINSGILDKSPPSKVIIFKGDKMEILRN